MTRAELLDRAAEALDHYLQGCNACTPDARIEALSVLALETSKTIDRVRKAADAETIRKAKRTI